MIASGLGAAASQRQPVVLLTGDLAFLHDIGALLMARRHDVNLTIVVFDNDGGGIFSLLPVAEQIDPEIFETHFRTPHGTDLEPVARAFGAAFARVTSWEHFRAAIKDGLGASGVSVVELPIDRDRSVAHRREIERRVCEALAREAEPL
jgi:2-succinyl-5-enolpyruvyl-6-hydroxy-3-cyclohexene-1-carboxylate synthase